MSRRKESSVQLKAITCKDGPVRVLAGPGSGKTFTIIQRILYLIRKKGVPPKEILTVTFTKAAATEMQQRYLTEIRQEGSTVLSNETVTFGTLHSICYHILNNSGAISRFSLIQEPEKRKIAEMILKNAGLFRDSSCKNSLSDFITEFLDAVSRYKNGLPIRSNSLLLSLLQENAALQEKISVEKLISEYRSYLLTKQLLDFDDMILKCRNLLQDNLILRKNWQKRFRYLLVDEFQDINEIQYHVLKLLAGPEHNLFVVGDDDQSIYGFRGAYPGIMKQFLLDFPDAVSLLLNENYRCAKDITLFSQRVIAGNANRIPKEIHAVKNGGRVIWFFAESRKEEERKLVSDMKALSAKQQNDCAVIVRTNREAGLYAALLKRNGCSVPVLTMHGAKGLEFDTVFLPDLNEGVIPGRNCRTKEEKEEERRLLYVAITRAKNHLFLYYTGERNRLLTPFLRGILIPHR